MFALFYVLKILNLSFHKYFTNYNSLEQFNDWTSGKFHIYVKSWILYYHREIFQKIHLFITMIPISLLYNIFPSGKLP